MTHLLTVAFPTLSPEDAEFIDAFRKLHDASRRNAVAAHFTLVFGCSSLGLHEYTEHVARVASSSAAIPFECRYAMLGADDQDDTAYVFLVPDHGFSKLSSLHDALYTGPLQPHLRLDLPYVPHITIGSTRNRPDAKALCDQLNARGVQVTGTISALAVGAVEDGVFKKLSTHALGEA